MSSDDEFGIPSSKSTISSKSKSKRKFSRPRKTKSETTTSSFLDDTPETCTVPLPPEVIEIMQKVISPNDDHEPSISRVASFDIGEKNLAFVVEEYDSAALQKLKTLSFFKNLYSKRKKKTLDLEDSEIQLLLDTPNLQRRWLYSTSERIYTGVYVLSDFHEFPQVETTADGGTSADGSNSKNWWTGEYYDFETEEVPMELELLNLLGKWEWLWETCTEVIIERQFMSAAGQAKPNFKAIAVAQSLKMYFHSLFGPSKRVSFVPSTWKTRDLGMKKKLNKSQRKKWCTQHARKIYNLREDKGGCMIFAAEDFAYRKSLNTVNKKVKKLRDFLASSPDLPSEYTKPLTEIYAPLEDRDLDEDFDVDIYCAIEDQLNTTEFLQNDITRLVVQIFFYRQKLDDISDSLCQLQAWKYRKYFC